jgi:predicted acylesterase/phospholipase RssA
MRKLFKWFYSQSSIHPPINGKTIENLCFKGGGMTGNAFVGVNHALIELGLLPQIKRFIGSSAGAIFAATVACRIPYSKMTEIIENTDFNKFEDSPWGIVGEGLRLIEHWGIYKGDYFYNWFGDFLKETVGSETITFQEVYERFDSELVITTTDLTEHKLIYLNHRDNPNMQIRDAVRRSMSIPAFYVPVKEIDVKGITHIYVDGGCTNNFPLHYFDDLYSNPDDAFGKTIGFNLVGEDEKKSDIKCIVSLIESLIYTEMETIQDLRLNANDKYRTVNINVFGLSYTDFNMSREDIQRLIDSGYTATINFFTL